MPEMTHLPSLSTAAPPNNAQRSNGAQRSGNAQNNGGNSQANGAKDQDERRFADVLQGKRAGAQAQEAAAQAGNEGKAESKDAAQDGEETAVLPQGTDTPPLTIDALIAQRLAATRPDGAAKGDASLGGAAGEPAGKAGRDALLGAGDPRGAAGGTLTGDARRSLAAGVLKEDAATAAGDAKAQLSASKETLESGGTDFTALLGRLRQEGSGKNAAATQAADNPTSTLSMLMPASANPVNDTQNTSATRPTNLIEAPVGSPMFADEAAQRVTWLAKNGIEHAEIRVTPPDMGPIQVSIDMSQNEASINFTVTQTDTRVALEDSLHRLEEMLADSGIALAQANIGQQDAGQQQSGRESGRAGAGSNARGGRDGDGRGEVAGVGGAVAASPARTGSVLGLVDTFA